jgi:hypothetical protein
LSTATTEDYGNGFKTWLLNLRTHKSCISATIMTFRGLPGFLHQSRRWNDFDDEDEEDGNDLGDNVKREGGHEAPDSKQQKSVL